MKSETLKLGGLDLRYVSNSGEQGGVPLLFVHGFPLSHKMWEEQLQHFGPRLPVIAPDLRGFGQSEAGAAGSISTMEMMAADLKALLDHLNVREVVFVGLSMGGYVAFEFYRKYPEQVSALVLADTRAQADTPEGKQTRYTQAAAAKVQGLEPVFNDFLPRYFSHEIYHTQPELIETTRAIMLENKVEGVTMAIPGLAERTDSTGLLPLITVPTLVIVGEEDVITPVQMSREMVEKLPNASFKLIAQAGHLSNMEQPEVFNRAIDEFLEANSTKTK